MTQVITMQGSNEQICDFLSNPVNNIILNMSGGLLPEHLSKNDVDILQNHFDKEFGGNADWFTLLGYREPEYKRSQYDRHILK